MGKKIKRRDFMITSAAGLTIAASQTAKTRTHLAPTMLIQGIKPVVVSSANGNQFKNGGDVTAVQKAFTMITQGADVLDAVIAGVNIVELDPLAHGYGFQRARNRLVSCGIFAPRFEANTSHVPSGLNIGNALNVESRVTGSGAPPLTRTR